MNSFVLVIIGMILLFISLALFISLSKALLKTEEWQEKYKKSPGWLRINDFTIYEWQVFWAVLRGVFEKHKIPSIRLQARIMRISYFLAFFIVIFLIVNQD